MSDEVRRRRFPPPWTIEENNNACFSVRDKSGMALGYFYFDNEPRTGDPVSSPSHQSRLIPPLPRSSAHPPTLGGSA
jgi:hypothetical protein